MELLCFAADKKSQEKNLAFEKLLSVLSKKFFQTKNGMVQKLFSECWRAIFAIIGL